MLAWLLAQGNDVVPIPGTRRSERVAENARAAEIGLSKADLAAISAVAGSASWAGNRQSFVAFHTERRPT
jgi:aryl-alcohol dehydrogenase-like predicted oxidoreductase